MYIYVSTCARHGDTQFNIFAEYLRTNAFREWKRKNHTSITFRRCWGHIGNIQLYRAGTYEIERHKPQSCRQSSSLFSQHPLAFTKIAPIIFSFYSRNSYAKGIAPSLASRRRSTIIFRPIDAPAYQNDARYNFSLFGFSSIRSRRSTRPPAPPSSPAGCNINQVPLLAKLHPAACRRTTP